MIAGAGVWVRGLDDYTCIGPALYRGLPYDEKGSGPAGGGYLVWKRVLTVI